MGPASCEGCLRPHSPSEVWILTNEADLSWWLPQGQVPRPYPAVIADGTRGPGPNWHSGALDHPKGGGEGARSHRLHPMQTATAVWSQRQGWRRGSPLFHPRTHVVCPVVPAHLPRGAPRPFPAAHLLPERLYLLSGLRSFRNLLSTCLLPCPFSPPYVLVAGDTGVRPRSCPGGARGWAYLVT